VASQNSLHTIKKHTKHMGVPLGVTISIIVCSQNFPLGEVVHWTSAYEINQKTFLLGV